ncbi:hypothetical protein AAF712_002243 [Marasmius tenuissimus]|uniref:Uncharacterized protein n=1 Tax=Marasmius tenuissimus TaxID=585030 RepID=A0ABR3A8W4_9AGAR
MSLSLFRQPTATTPSGGVKAFLFAFFVVIYILLYLRYLRPTYPKEHLPETRLLLAILGSTHITFQPGYRSFVAVGINDSNSCARNARQLPEIPLVSPAVLYITAALAVYFSPYDETVPHLEDTVDTNPHDVAHQDNRDEERKEQFSADQGEGDPEKALALV